MLSHIMTIVNTITIIEKKMYSNNKLWWGRTKVRNEVSFLVTQKSSQHLSVKVVEDQN